MESWYADLRRRGLIDRPPTVTGYDTMLGAGGGCDEITRRFSWMTAASSGDHLKAPPRPVHRGEMPAANDKMFEASA